MSSLRRRIFGESSTEPSREVTPEKDEEVRLISTEKLKHLTHKATHASQKGRKRRNGLIFGLGGLFGIVLAAFFANQHDVDLRGMLDMNFYEGLLDVIPAGVLREAKDITVC